MARHLVRKFFGLIVLYIIIIFGIFAIQFRREMSIFQNFQSLTLRLSGISSQTVENETELSNNFRISGNGVVIFASESNPLLLQDISGDSTPLELQDWEQLSDNSFSLMFSDDVSLTFETEEKGFKVLSTLPEISDTIIIPYQAENSFTITDMFNNEVLVKSKEQTFSLNAGSVTTNAFLLSGNTTSLAQVFEYVETQKFSFNDVLAMENASQVVLDTFVSQAKNHIVRSFENLQGDINNEKFVAAYVAEMALQGQYTDAIERVPASFKGGNNRTYFTAPYFNTLVAMNQTLIMENENISFSMDYSLERGLLDVFTVENFPIFLLQQRTSEIEEILSMPATITNFSPTLQEAVGILNTYIVLAERLPTFAQLLSPVLETCIAVIEDSTTLEGSLLSLSFNDEIEDAFFLAKTGFVLREYGSLSSRAELEAAGTMLQVSSLQNTASIDAVRLSQMYPYIIANNPYYPHADVLGYNNEIPVWMWNIIPEKAYVRDSDGTVTMNFDFPVTAIYHSIIIGIEPFSGVEIYDLDYATDPRFETYNAPGYVYQEETGTLLLRYRQRSEVEEMKLFSPVEVAPDPVTVEPVTPAVETVGSGESL